MAASPLPSLGPKKGRKCYITPVFSGVPNAKRGKQNQEWLPQPALLGNPKEVGKVATLPVPSWGSQHSTRGQNPEMAKKPKCGQGGYITPTILGVPNAQRGDKN